MHWIHSEYIEGLHPQTDPQLQVNGLECTIRRYKLEIKTCLVNGWYSDLDKEWLNELRSRYIHKSLDIHLVNGIWI